MQFSRFSFLLLSFYSCVKVCIDRVVSFFVADVLRVCFQQITRNTEKNNFYGCLTSEETLNAYLTRRKV